VARKRLTLGRAQSSSAPRADTETVPLWVFAMPVMRILWRRAESLTTRSAAVRRLTPTAYRVAPAWTVR
jgi:hypothetical protein